MIFFNTQSYKRVYTGKRITMRLTTLQLRKVFNLGFTMKTEEFLNSVFFFWRAKSDCTGVISREKRKIENELQFFYV